MVRFRTNQVVEKNRQGKKGIGLSLVYPSAEAVEIIGFLDRGVTGILGPHIETAEDVQALVDACRFVPDGQRSLCGERIAPQILSPLDLNQHRAP